jgi:hypothetical protein
LTTKTLYRFLISPTSATCSIPLIFLDLYPHNIWWKMMKLTTVFVSCHGVLSLPYYTSVSTFILQCKYIHITMTVYRILVQGWVKSSNPFPKVFIDFAWYLTSLITFKENQP